MPGFVEQLLFIDSTEMGFVVGFSDDLDRATMGEVVEIERDVHCCAKCSIPMTSATAEDREDGIYCDKCLTEFVDGDSSYG